MKQFLSPLKEPPKIFDIFAFDIETYSEYNYFYMGSLMGKNIKRVFFNKQEFIDFIKTLDKPKTIIFATNLQFDLFALFENTMDFFDLKLVMRGSEVIGCRFKKILFLDTMNFARYSVNTLGIILKKEKLIKPKFLGQIPKNKKELNELINYNLRDTEITYEFGEFLQDSFLKFNTSLGYTIASTSMKTFRMNYLDCNIQQPSKKIIDFLQNAYYGGRTEIFKSGYYKELKYYDFNSLYPAQYLKPFPNPNFIKYRKNADSSVLKYEGVSKVKVVAPSYLEIPFLSYRFENKKLLFPLGKFKASYSHVELRKANTLGYKIKILETYYYTKNFYPFKQFGIDLYKLRMKYKKSRNPFELPIKILLNSLYGKFAQKYSQTEIDFLRNYTKEDVVKLIRNPDIKISLVDMFIYIEKLSGHKIPKFINPIFSLYITAYGRIVLYELFEKLGFKNVFYCDTDSVITNKTVETSEKLGGLKLEHDIKIAILVKPKVYLIVDEETGNTIIKCKSIPRNFFTGYPKFIEFLKNPEIEYIKFVKFKEAIRSKEHYKRGKLKFNQKIKVSKSFILEDDKRDWGGKPFDIYKNRNSKPLKLPLETV